MTYNVDDWFENKIVPILKQVIEHKEAETLSKLDIFKIELSRVLYKEVPYTRNANCFLRTIFEQYNDIVYDDLFSQFEFFLTDILNKEDYQLNKIVLQHNNVNITMERREDEDSSPL